jgi:hypothetical protein
VYDNNNNKPASADGTFRGRIEGTYLQGEWLTLQFRTTTNGYGWWLNGVAMGGATWQEAGLGFGPGEEFEHGAQAAALYTDFASCFSINPYGWSFAPLGAACL